MIASAIFALILVLSLFAARGRRTATVWLHLAALIAVGALFAHHVTESLNLSF